MAPLHVWLRDEMKKGERRTAITPQDAKVLLAAGLRVTVEQSELRCWPITEYMAVGCDVAASGTWQTLPADEDLLVVGLKELADGSEPLPHKFIHFAHCFKKQAGWKEMLRRFTAGNGTLYDLEYLTDANGRRLIAFGVSAGFVGMAFGLYAWIHQMLGDAGVPWPSTGATHFPSNQELVDHVRPLLAQAIAKNGGVAPKVFVIGALGRCGRGATDFATRAGLSVDDLILWDMKETAPGGPFPELLQATIFLNCILFDPNVPSPPFLTRELLQRPGRKLSVLVDVSCDTSNPNHPVPVYDDATSFDAPCTRVLTASEDAPVFDVVAIDHLPSFVPTDSSAEFSAGLARLILDFRADSDGVWGRARSIFEKFGALAAQE
eukprot:TRINITY_DN28029_c0_g1_i1.p1 TRINITY_DN28029_c0_g1~~TRINITY_DN28029_c0_g1_i1.p1  ORF type:complete len:378 (+),score=68.79 TRINITY_DN28029_c0_g1_i1:43-1176(+)